MNLTDVTVEVQHSTPYPDGRATVYLAPDYSDDGMREDHPGISAVSVVVDVADGTEIEPGQRYTVTLAPVDGSN